jgi:hypothetical protein
MSRDLSLTLTLVTPTQQDIFLTVFRETGLWHKAAAAAGTTKSAIQRYCENKTEDAETFLLNIQAASGAWADTIEAEMTRRAIEGVEKDVYYKGQVVGTEIVYSDSLLSKMADAHIPAYAKTKEQESGGVSIVINTFTSDTPQVIVEAQPSEPTYISDLE